MNMYCTVLFILIYIAPLSAHQSDVYHVNQYLDIRYIYIYKY